MDTELDLRWNTFALRAFAALGTMLLGQILFLMLNGTLVVPLWASGLVFLASLGLTFWLIRGRQNEDEFDRSLRWKACAQAGVIVVLAVAIWHFQAAIRDIEPLPVFALPGYLALIYVVLEQYLRWDMTREMPNEE